MEDLRSLIAAGESETLEFKQEAASKIGKEVAAFASTSGGVIIVGIEDDTHAVLGLADAKIDRDRITNWIHAYVFPAPAFVVSETEIDGNAILVVRVDKGQEPVYSFQDNPYYRIGKLSERMTAAEVKHRYAAAMVIAKIEALDADVKQTHPSLHVAAAIFGQCELATMPYQVLLRRLIDDLGRHFVKREDAPPEGHI